VHFYNIVFLVFTATHLFELGTTAIVVAYCAERSQ